MGAMLLAAALAGAAPGTVEFDIECVIALGSVGEVDAEMEQNVKAASLFYFGRVDVALKDQALENRLLQVGAAMQGKDVGPYLVQCGEFMILRSEELTP